MLLCELASFAALLTTLLLHEFSSVNYNILNACVISFNVRFLVIYLLLTSNNTLDFLHGVCKAIGLKRVTAVLASLSTEGSHLWRASLSYFSLRLRPIILTERQKSWERHSK